MNGTRILKGLWMGGRVAGVLLVALTTLSAEKRTGTFPGDRPPNPGSLRLFIQENHGVPLPPTLDQYVTNRQAAIVLGKALFWDQQAGSDGLACASCHFQAGADNRVKNTMSPGLRNEKQDATNTTFNQTVSNRNSNLRPPYGGGGPNYTLKKADFPFHLLSDPDDPNSAVIADTDDVVSSQGVYHRDFVALLPNSQRHDACLAGPSTFSVNGVNVRQSEPRNTPTVINAIFNFRNFWDGRANNFFNGRNPFGLRDPTVGSDPLNSIIAVDDSGNIAPFPVIMTDASLASQAVGPALSNLEMSCGGRVFEALGQKLLKMKPLSGQIVDPTDSVLGPYAGKISGATFDYTAQIQKAFNPKFWNSSQLTIDGYTLIQKNFSLFWGLSIMLYESTLVSDDAPFDRYMGDLSRTADIGAMTTQQLRGFGLYQAKGCVFCHRGPEFTSAASTLATNKRNGAGVENMVMGDGQLAIYDTGFYNLGVRQPVEDIGTGGMDQWGVPLSWTRQAKNASNVTSGNPQDLFAVGPDLFNLFTCTFEAKACAPMSSFMRDAIDGSFKVPTLRNVELTGPYFHNGGQATLEQVIDFYDRGGDSVGTLAENTTGYKGTPSNLPPSIFFLNLSDGDKADLVAFLKALTDERVRWEKAPFDHPSLRVPNGHTYNETLVLGIGPMKQAIDEYISIPAVGAAGRTAKQGPLKTFDAGLLP